MFIIIKTIKPHLNILRGTSIVGLNFSNLANKLVTAGMRMLEKIINPAKINRVSSCVKSLKNIFIIKKSKAVSSTDLSLSESHFF